MYSFLLEVLRSDSSTFFYVWVLNSRQSVRNLFAIHSAGFYFVSNLPSALKLTNNYRIRIIGILVIALLRFGLFGSVTFGMDRGISFAYILGNILLASILIWETSRLVVTYFHRRYALNHISTQRFASETFTLFIANGLIYSISLLIHEGKDVFRIIHPLFLLYGLFYTFLFGVLVAALYELLFYMWCMQIP